MATPASTTRSDFYVYALFRENGVPFYIGKGHGRRLADHDMAARRGDKGYRNAVIRDMHARGVELIRAKVHEGLTETAAHVYEVALIAAIGRHPHGPLTNLTDGGEGFTGLKRVRGRKQSIKHIANRAAALRGKKLAPERAARLLAANLGKKASAKTRAKMSAIRLGRKPTEETVKKSAMSRRGKKRTAEQCAHIAAGLKSSKAVKEQIARLAEGNRGRKHSPDAIANMSAAQAGKKQSRDHIAKRMAAHIGKTRSAAARANMKAAQIAGAERRRAAQVTLAGRQMTFLGL
jgi:hypothetical protein